MTNIDWQEEVEISYDYAKYGLKFINMLSELEFMWDGHMGRVEEVRHKLEFSAEDSRPIRSMPIRAGLEVWEFGKNKIAEMLEQYVIEHAPTDWESPIFLDPRKRTVRSESVLTAENVMQ